MKILSSRFSMWIKLLCLLLLTYGVAKSNQSTDKSGYGVPAVKEMIISGDHARIDYTNSGYQDIVDICSNISKSLIYIRTTYLTRMVEDGTENTVENIGVGIVVSRNGLAVAPQHVFRPWLYDRKILALIDLDFVEIVPGSARFSAWSAEQQTETCDTNQADYKMDSAYTHGVNERGLLVLYAAEPTILSHQLNSLFGPVSINEAISDHTDIIVFQLFYKNDQFQSLTLRKKDKDIKPNGKVLVIGFELTQLLSGNVITQVSAGKIHRVVDELIELDLVLQPGSSGSPVVDENGDLLGMVIASLNNGDYGIALSSNAIRNALSLTRGRVKAQELRLTKQGCSPGAIDGLFDEILWSSLKKGSCLYYENR